MKSPLHSPNFWIAVGIGLFAIYQLVTQKPKQKMFDEGDNYL